MKNIKHYCWIIPLLFLSIQCHKNTPHHEWSDLAQTHLQRYPDMAARDLYKMIYQGNMGPGHLGTDSVIIQKYLQREVDKIDADSSCELIENISPDSSIVRINLKKFKSMNGNVSMFAGAVARSAQYPGNPDEVMKIWKIIGARISAGDLPLALSDYEYISEKLADIPDMIPHHTEQYIRSCAPAYRVVRLSEWKRVELNVFGTED